MHMCSIWLYVVYTLHRTTLIPCPFFSSNRQGWKKTSLISVIFLLLPFLHVCVLFCFFWENDKKYTFCSSAPANPPRKTIHTKICSVICVFASLTLLACPASKGIPLKRGGWWLVGWQEFNTKHLNFTIGYCWRNHSCHICWNFMT